LGTNKENNDVACPKCSSENSADAKFCSNCGFNFTASSTKRKFDGSAALLLAGSLYLLLGIALNQLIQADIRLAIPAVLSGLLGLYAAYALMKGQANKATFSTALISIALGLGLTFLIFLIGVVPIVTNQSLLGVTGAAWIIYALAAFWLYRDTRSTS
jgi:hypothetical protein